MAEVIYDLEFLVCEHADGENDEPKACPLSLDTECQCCAECRNECQLEAEDGQT